MEASLSEFNPDEASSAADWRRRIGWTCALLMAVVWLVAGMWKLSSISKFELMLNQLLIPAWLTLPATLAVAVSEVFAGALLLRPTWRRLGGLLSTALLIVFMAYMAMNYDALRGADCSCFPWIERSVGPAFFWSDAALVALSLGAVWFAPRIGATRQAATLLAGVAALAGVALAYDRLGPQPGAEVPERITVEGQPYSLRAGKVFIYFFNPTCLHCLDVGTELSRYSFQADFLGVPTQDPDFAEGFLGDAGLTGKVKLSPDLELLKQAFPFEDVPYAAVIENGRVLERLRFFEQPKLENTLRERGVIE